MVLMMDLYKALRIKRSSRLAFVGAGGKSTAIFQLARLCDPPVLVTASTHMADYQTSLADRWLVVDVPEDLPAAENIDPEVLLITGALYSSGRTQGLPPVALRRLSELASLLHCPLLVEADGSRQRPLKAPASHEPAIPDFCDEVVVCAGLSGLGRHLSEDWIHRPGRFSELTGLAAGDVVGEDDLVRLLIHPEGGLKGIPKAARRIVLLNQADNPEMQARAGKIARNLLQQYAAVLVASLAPPGEKALPSRGSSAGGVAAVHERTAGVILAAGGAIRYGQPKLLLPWKGEAIIRHVTRAARFAGLDPLVVVAGEYNAYIRSEVEDLGALVVENQGWADGQSTSLKAGLSALPDEIGAAVFMLGDQPQIPPGLVQALVETHAASLAPLVAPMVDGQRANPVLFDRQTFPALMLLQGDTGGRSLFAKYPVEWVQWHDPAVLLDVDTPQDYQRLLEL